MWPWCGGSSRAHPGEALRPCPPPFLKKGRTLSARHQPYPCCKALRLGLLTVSTRTAARELPELAVGRRRRVDSRSEVPPASRARSPRPTLLGFAAAEHAPPPALEEEPEGAPSPPWILLEATRTLDEEVVKISCSNKNETQKESIFTASSVGSPDL